MSSNTCSNRFKIDYLINSIWFYCNLSCYSYSSYFIYSCYTNCILFNIYLLIFVIDNKILIVIWGFDRYNCDCMQFTYILSLFSLYISLSITNSFTMIISTSILFCYHKCITILHYTFLLLLLIVIIHHHFHLLVYQFISILVQCHYDYT